jgi:hypothetical protein
VTRSNLPGVLAICILYNQRDATYTMFFIISALHVSGGFSAHHQELITLFVQPWNPSYTSGRQQESMTIPKAAQTVLEAPEDGRKTARNM